ncbi:UNVERIFIED_CONTAM: hypothetical protein H355_014249 [Colinus virginianus]|nr:hypothetical protein H355_014249 [Colinus virginianus]
MDVRNEAQVVAAVGKALDEVHTIDILINGAGGNFLCSAADLKYKGFKAVMEIDAHGAFIVSKTIFDMCFKPEAHRCAKQLANRPSSRRKVALPSKVIINISATLHYTAVLLQTHAGTAKAAVDALTRHLAVEWGPYNIRVNSVAPGPISGTVGLSKLNPYGKSSKLAAAGEKPTNQESQLRKSEANRPWRNVVEEKSNDAASYERLSEAVPLQRLGLPDDVAYATLFLCLPEAR